METKILTEFMKLEMALDVIVILLLFQISLLLFLCFACHHICRAINSIQIKNYPKDRGEDWKPDDWRPDYD